MAGIDTGSEEYRMGLAARWPTVEAIDRLFTLSGPHRWEVDEGRSLGEASGRVLAWDAP